MNAPTIIGRYEIIEELGHGAMGSVFKARDPAVGRTVALKTIHATALAGEQGDEFRERFYREARASGVLAHPGIVPVFDVGDHGGAPFLVMEFVEGRTLDAAVKKGERFSLDRMCEICQQIAEALGYAHRRGVIHRDIKPANILLTSREIYGIERPRITDFGIAKLAASDITTIGQVLGTPSYMSPEQLNGFHVDGRADIYSLGVILYLLVTGEQPFPGETLTAISYKVVHVEPIPPSKLNPSTPERLENAILKCLAKNSAERFQTSEDLAHELAAIRAGAGQTVQPKMPDTLLDTAVTMGPGQAAKITSHDEPADAKARTPHRDQKQKAAGADKHPPIAATAPTAKKAGKPAPFETVFGAVLLGIAALAGIGTGGWFLYQRIHSEIEEHWKKANVNPPTPPPNPIKTVVPVPQPNTGLDQPPPPGTEPEPDKNPPSSTTPAPGKTTPEPAQVTSGKITSVTPAKTAPVTPSKSKTQTPVKSKSPAQTVPSNNAANQTVAQNVTPPSGQISGNSTGTTSSVVANPSPSGNDQKNPPPAVFDPRKLDPNTSTKLKIDPSRLPTGVAVTLSMNRKPYLSFTTGDKTDLENLYVPAGVQEFRAVIKTADQQFESKGVPQDFKAKKKKTLRIELTENGNSLSGATLPLPKDVQVYISFPFSLADLF
jgi:serine/threonine protein kinase